MKTKIMKRNNVLPGWAALLLLLVFSGCAPSILYWNQATEKFDQAAEMEMTSRFAQRMIANGSTPPAGAVPSVDKLFSASSSVAQGSAEQLYRMADDKISKALAAPAPLKKEEKLANALTLKALTCWKTGQAENARINAAKALQEFGSQQETSPRDQPLARAVPGLVALDLAYDTTKMLVDRLKSLAEEAPDMPEAEAKQLIADARMHYQEYVSDADSDHSIAGAQKDLNAAMELAGENKDMQIYLLLCQLAGLKNQFDLWAQLDNFAKRSGQKAADTELRTWLGQQEQAYLQNKNAALENLKQLMGGNTDNDVYRYWNGVL